MLFLIQSPNFLICKMWSIHILQISQVRNVKSVLKTINTVLGLTPKYLTFGVHAVAPLFLCPASPLFTVLLSSMKCCCSRSSRYCSKALTTVEPWTIQVWTAWVHLHVDFFSINTCMVFDLRLGEHGWGGTTICIDLRPFIQGTWASTELIICGSPGTNLDFQGSQKL